MSEESDGATLIPCAVCGVHARNVCGHCEKKICTAHSAKGNDGKTYCPDHIGAHTGEGN